MRNYLHMSIFCCNFVVGIGSTMTSLLCNSCNCRNSSSPQKLKFPGTPDWKIKQINIIQQWKKTTI